MDKNKLLSLMGLCKKAGRLLQGIDVVTQGVRQGKVVLVLTAEDLAPRSLRRLTEALEDTGCEQIAIPVTKDEIGIKTGKMAGIVGVADAGFAKAMKKIIRSKALGEPEVSE